MCFFNMLIWLYEFSVEMGIFFYFLEFEQTFSVLLKSFATVYESYYFIDSFSTNVSSWFGHQGNSVFIT